MITQTLAVTFNDFKAALIIGICVMVLIGWILNLRAKNRISNAERLLAGEFGKGSEQEFGEILGAERFQSVQGLPGYPPPTLWQRFFGGGAAMELIFTNSSLIFCDPTAANCVKQTTVSLKDVVSVRTDYNDGSTLIIKVTFGTIRCESQRTLGAKPAKKVLDEILNANRNVTLTFARNTPSPNFNCNHCGQNIDAPAGMSGAHANCPTCGGSIMVPSIPLLKPPTPPQRAAETTSGSGSAGVITTVISVIAVVILARACGSNFGRNLAEERIAERERGNAYLETPTNTVEDSLKQYVRLASAGLPKMVDRITRLDSVTLQNGNTIVEAYTITTLAKNELDVPGLSSDLNHKIKSDFRTDTKTKTLRDNNVVWVWKYYDRNGELMITVTSSS